MKKKILLAVFITLIVCVATIVSVSAQTDNSGINFTNTDYYKSVNALSQAPLTFEAWITVSEDMPNSAKGPIAGTYNGNNADYDAINFEIAEFGVPKVYIRQKGANEATQIYFLAYDAQSSTVVKPIDLRTGELTHLAITLDPENNKAYCYINGELKSTFSGEYYYYSNGSYGKSGSKSYNISSLSSMNALTNIAIGRDNRTGTYTSYLNGDYATINSVALYSNTLAQSDINSDINGIDYTNTELMAAYNLTTSGNGRLKDYSLNENHLYYTNTADSSFAEYYRAPGFKPTNTDYYQSLEVLGDVPLTFETWITVSPDMTDTSKGTIIGTYNGNNNECDAINFEIAEMGVPEVYIRKKDVKDAVQIYFLNYDTQSSTVTRPIDLRTGEPTHIAITLDPSNNKAYCYINGELKSTYSGQKYYYDSASSTYKKWSSTSSIKILSEMNEFKNIAIGRDHRGGNYLSYLNGNYAEIHTAALYSNTLAQSEVKANANKQNIDYDYVNLIAAYDLTISGNKRLKDYSNSENHLYYTNTSDSSAKEYYKAPGLKPNATDYYQSTDYLSSFPYTFEAWVNVSADTPDTFEGPIAGNYDAASGDAVNFIISKLGVPRVYLKPYNEQTNSYGSNVDIYFPEVDLRTGKPTHLAITFDPSANRAYCYVNGELKSTYEGQKYYYNSSTNLYGKYSSTANINIISNLDYLKNIAIGKDHRTGSNLFALDGKYVEICSIAMYSKLLSASEISEDLKKVDYSNEYLISAYDFTKSGKEVLKDYSNNKVHLFYSNIENRNLTEWYETIEGGFSFPTEDFYRTDDIPKEIPHTFEASVYLPLNNKIKFAGGVIASTLGFDKGGLALEIGNGGTVIFTTTDQNGITSEFIFDTVCIYNKEVTHIAVTIDEENGKIKCYINGELAQSLELGDILYKSYHIAYGIGGDYRTNNKYAFAGKILSCAMYSDVRSAEEIANDINTLDKSDLIVAYDYSNSSESGAYPEKLKDLSDNCNDAIIPVYLIGAPIESDFEASYSFAIIGDTQSLNYYYQDKLSYVYNWILNNIDDKNIKFVMGLGDITETNNKNEWEAAKAQILKLQGKVPYSLAVGNHDTSAMLNSMFSNTGYEEQISGSYNGNLENTYQEITVGTVKYLIFALDCGASDEVLDWAGAIISANPEHNVIITTHAYLNRDGSTLDASDRGNVTEWGYSNNGDDMWEKLISKYENIVLVLSGHIISDEIITSQRVGKNGNIVTEMLINPQNVDAKLFPAGLVAMLYFSEDGKDVRVEYYSTVQEKYFMQENQFEITLDTVEFKSPISTFVPKANITLDANLIFNVYIPASDALSSFTFDGVEYTNFSSLERKIIGANTYYVFKVPLASGEAARDIKLVAKLEVGNTEIIGSFTFSIAKYAKNILKGTNESEKALIMDVLAYIKAAYMYFNSQTVDEIENILGSYEKELVVEGSSNVPKIPGIKSVSFDLTAEPCMKFYLEDGYSASDFIFVQNHIILNATEDSDKNGRYARIKLYAYGMCETVKITFGNQVDTYHINSYYEFAKKTSDEKLITLVEAFWNYCQAARDYRIEKNS